MSDDVQLQRAILASLQQRPSAAPRSTAALPRPSARLQPTQPSMRSSAPRAPFGGGGGGGGGMGGLGGPAGRRSTLEREGIKPANPNPPGVGGRIASSSGRRPPVAGRRAVSQPKDRQPGSGGRTSGGQPFGGAAVIGNPDGRVAIHGQEWDDTPLGPEDKAEDGAFPSPPPVLMPHQRPMVTSWREGGVAGGKLVPQNPTGSQWMSELVESSEPFSSGRLPFDDMSLLISDGALKLASDEKVTLDGQAKLLSKRGTASCVIFAACTDVDSADVPMTVAGATIHFDPQGSIRVSADAYFRDEQGTGLQRAEQFARPVQVPSLSRTESFTSVTVTVTPGAFSVNVGDKTIVKRATIPDLSPATTTFGVVFVGGRVTAKKLTISVDGAAAIGEPSHSPLPTPNRGAPRSSNGPPAANASPSQRRVGAGPANAHRVADSGGAGSGPRRAVANAQGNAAAAQMGFAGPGFGPGAGAGGGGGGMPAQMPAGAGNSDVIDPFFAEKIEAEIMIRKPNVSYDDIASLGDAKRVLNEAVILPLLVPEFFVGIRAPWRGVLLFGPPGTGKTLLAKAVATCGGTTFFNMSAASLITKFHGESEKMVKTLFQLARKHAPSTVFFDEVDALMMARGEGSEHEASRRLKSEMLQQIDGISAVSGSGAGDDTIAGGPSEQPRVMVLCTTNKPWDLDDAMRRRLEKRIYIPLPDHDARIEMLKIHTKTLDLENDVNFDELAAKTDGYSGSDLYVLCRDAALTPLRRIVAGKAPEELALMKQRGQLEAGKLKVSGQDFEEAVRKSSKSVGPQELRRYQEWFDEFGSV